MKKYVALIVAIVLIVFASGCSSAKKTNEDIYNNSDVNKNETDKTTNKNSDNKDEKDEVLSLLGTMTLEEKIGQLLMPDFRKYDGKKVTVINDAIGQMIKDYHIGGIILFKENCVSRNQTKQLIKDFQKYAEIPLMLSIDQEGGLVTRLQFAPTMPGNMALGATDDEAFAEEVGKAIGSELNDLGIHINFGPVVDVNSNEDNPVIGVRSFGDNVELVTRMGLAYMKGLNAAGVAAVGKHFPGHGDVDLDSHYVLPSSEKTLEDIKEIELVPYKKLIGEGIQGIMTAHITFKNIDPTTAESMKDGLPIELPATLSPKILTDLLRKDMKFDGIVFTDAMMMKAVDNHFGQVDAAIRTINAGADVVLMPTDVKLVYNGLLEAARDGILSKERIDESVERILRFKYEYIINQDKNKLDKIDAVKGVEIEQKVANASITLVKNDEIIPFKIDNDKIAIIGFNSVNVKRMTNAVKSNYWKTESIQLNKSLNVTGKLSSKQKDHLKDVTKIIVVTNTSNKKDGEWQTKIVKDIINQGIDTVIVAARNPYELEELDGAKALIAQYDSGVASFNATADVMFGNIEAKGKLPVQYRMISNLYMD